MRARSVLAGASQARRSSAHASRDAARATERRTFARSSSSPARGWAPARSRESARSSRSARSASAAWSAVALPAIVAPNARNASRSVCLILTRRVPTRTARSVPRSIQFLIVWWLTRSNGDRQERVVHHGAFSQLESKRKQRRRSTMRNRISPTTIIASVALFFSLTGAGLAATGYRITSLWQIAPKVRHELRGQCGPQGPAGPQGGPGQQGATGPEGQTGSSRLTGADHRTRGGRGKPGRSRFRPNGPLGRAVLPHHDQLLLDADRELLVRSGRGGPFRVRMRGSARGSFGRATRPTIRSSCRLG
jgi:hypothetical protein